MDFDFVAHNRKAWNSYSEQQESNWVKPVCEEDIERARHGELRLFLTPTKTVPSAWLPPLVGCKVLCLASGGGQQTPLFAAAGADVTVFDNSDAQLEMDVKTCETYGLKVTAVRGDMRNLCCFEDGSFDFIFHPVSNVFVDNVRIVWSECARVLKKGGTMIAGFNNPILYIFDAFKLEEGQMEVVHSLPYTPFIPSASAETEQFIADGDALEWSHTLTDQIGGQTDAGFAVLGLYEDGDRPGDETALGAYTPIFIATRSVKV